MNAHIDFGRPQIVVRNSRFSLRLPRRTVIVVTALTALAIGLGIFSLATGAYTLSVGQVVGALTGHETGLPHTVVVDWRLPRVFLAGLFGAALGLSGAMFQSLTRNPLGSPDIIGFDTGAYTGVLIVTLVIGSTGLYSTTTGAVLGGLLTAALVYLFAYRRGVQGFRLIIVGIGVTAMLGSFDTWLLLRLSTQDAIRASFWGAGALDSVGSDQVLPAACILGILFLSAAALNRSMRLLELGDDTGQQLGVPAERIRLLLVIVGVGLSATVTSIAGPIAFISLSAPQIARRLTASAGATLGGAAMTGCILLIAADWLAQNAFPVTIPVGVVTVVLGGGYFLWLLIAEGRRR